MTNTTKKNPLPRRAKRLPRFGPIDKTAPRRAFISTREEDQ